MSDRLQVVYDMSMNPVSYDFLPFLACAEKHRIERGIGAMDVHFMPAEDGSFYERYYPKDVSERHGLLWRVCVPACRLLKSVRDVHVYAARQGVGGEQKFPETWAASRPDITHGATWLKRAPRVYTASSQAKKWVTSQYKDYVTITLRDCPYGEDRNSDRVEWWKVARGVKDRGANVVIVPDTYGKPLKDWPNCLPASWDIDIRLALYEGALVNFGGANGPMSLCILSHSRFIMLDTELFGHDINGGIFPGKPQANRLIDLAVPYLQAAA